MAELLEKAMDMALDKKDPKRRLERRRAREAKRTTVQETRGASPPRPDEFSSTGTKESSRYIPSKVRERVHARASHQCQYRGPDGTRCGSRTGLEIEHERPFSLYRSHEERYLKVFCKSHNRLAAERVFGATFLEKKIAASRERVRAAPRADSSS